MGSQAEENDFYLTGTPTLQQGSWKYTCLICIVSVVTVLAYRVSLIEQQEDVKKSRELEGYLLPDIMLSSGTYVNGLARKERQTYYTYMDSLAIVRENLEKESARIKDNLT